MVSYNKSTIILS
jgi:hypothetical protein